MKTVMIFKSLFIFGLLFLALQATAQTTIAHDGGFIKNLDKVYGRLEEIEPYPATLMLSIDPKTNRFFVTVTPEKGEPYTLEFAKPTRKEKCANLIGTGKTPASGIKFRVSGLGCKIAHPKITIRNNKNEIYFLLTDEGNLGAVSELKKLGL